MTVEERAKQMVQQAEAVKAKIFDISGRHDYANYYENQKEQNLLLHSVVADDDYAIVAAHVDESLKRRIIEGEYVDFSRLVPRDRVSLEADKSWKLSQKMAKHIFNQ